MKKTLTLGMIPLSTDLALLALRVWLGLSLFIKHGIEKITNFSMWKDHFPDLINIGSTASLTFALFADGIFSLFVLIGFGTRWAALFIIINLLVVFTLMHEFSFAKEHAELVYLYLGGYITLLIGGGGKYSLENLIRF